MHTSFNLVDQPFITCVLPNDACVDMSLRDALVRSHSIREIRDECPLATVSLHRLLLAILHRVFGPESLRQWRTLWERREKGFEATPIKGYLDKWRDRFDLLDQDFPFYQTAGMETNSPLPVTSLFDNMASGNNATLFDHSADENCDTLPLARAAVGLLVRQNFDIGFGKSPNCRIRGKDVVTGYRSDAPLTRGMTILIRGNTLFETLVLNLTRYQPSADDLPAWESDSPEQSMRYNVPSGRLDLYTWQSRRLRLVTEALPDGLLVASGVHYAQGRSMAPSVVEPLKPYRKREDQSWSPYPVAKDRAAWRDSSSLLHLARKKKDERLFEALNWVARAVDDGAVPVELSKTVDVFGICTDEGKAASILLWRHESFPLPLKYLRDDSLVDNLKSALETAEGGARALRFAVWSLAENLCKACASAKPDKQRVADMVRSVAAETKYWSDMETPFRTLMLELARAAEDVRAALIADWIAQVKRIAGNVFHRIVDSLDESPRLLRAVFADSPERRGANCTLYYHLASLGNGPQADTDSTTTAT